MSMEFLPICEADLESIVEIENQSHIHPWSKGVFRDCLRVSYVCDMVKSDGCVLVYGIMSVAAGEAHVFNVCVNAEFRRQGYGEKMMQHLLAKAKNQKAETAFLEVRPSNEVAISLYEKIGFKITGRRKDYYPSENGREDAVIMSMGIFSSHP